mgnify:FL=1
MKRTAEHPGGGRNPACFTTMTDKNPSTPISHPRQIAVSDRVGFFYEERECHGTVYRKGTRYAYVVGDDRRQFRIPYPLLRRLSCPPSAAPPSPASGWRLAFRVNDRVRFAYGGRVLEATIVRLNPKRAHVLCDNGDEFRVSYASLEMPTAAEKTATRGDEKRLEIVARQARQLLDHHGLKEWGFHFDEGTRRAGCCRFDRKTISLSLAFAVAGAEAQIEETLLHEIAHALVGRNHHHDALWRAKAVEIGCSGRRCHDFRFASPRYIVHCENRCWVTTAERRTKGGVCRRCRGALVYLSYSEARYREEVARVGPEKP